MDTETFAFVKPRVMVLRMVVMSLLIGLVAFMGIAVFLVSREMIQSIGTKVVTYMAAGMMVLAVIGQFFLVNLLDKQARQQLDPKQEKPWLDQFQARTIMGCALLEGPAFMGIIGYMLEHDALGLIVGGVGAVAMFALYFPTEGKMIRHVERQRELAIQETMNRT